MAKKKRKVSKKKKVKNKSVKKKAVKKITKKKAVKKPIKKKPVEKKSRLAFYSFVLSIISLVVLVAYIFSLIMLNYFGGFLIVFTYLAALVVFIVAMFGVALSTADLAVHPGNEVTRKTLYLNLIILSVTFTLFLIKIL